VLPGLKLRFGVGISLARSLVCRGLGGAGTDRANRDGYLGGCSEIVLVVYECQLGLSIDMRALFANFLALLLFAVAAMGVRAADIAVVMSSDANVYQGALEGFREVVRHRILSAQIFHEGRHQKLFV